MSPLLKKFQALSLALLVLISPLLITAQEPTKPGKIYLEYGLDPERTPIKPKTSVPRGLASGTFSGVCKFSKRRAE